MKIKWNISRPYLFLLITLLFLACNSNFYHFYPVLNKTIRSVVKENYNDGTILIGAATGSWSFGEIQGKLLDREFSYVTPENDYKHSEIRSDPNSWKWEKADAWRQHIIDNNQILRIHSPIGPQCSEWAKDDARTGQELKDELILFMKTVCERYNGKPGYKYIDVVNETVHNGSWHKNKPGKDSWECPWFIIGQDTNTDATPLFIKYAFETASNYAPNLKFIYNHDESPDITGSWDLIKSTIFYLRTNGLRVDGIGWQAHVDAGFEQDNNKIQKLKELITWAHTNSLEFHITEASVFMKNGYSKPELDKQATTYRTLLKTLLEKRSSGVVAWNTWHVSDATGYHAEWTPSLFDNNYVPKISYYAILELLAANKDH